MKFIFLAAGKGERIFKKINKNKCLLELKNKTLIENSIDEVLKTGIKKIVVVTGFSSRKLVKKLRKYRNIKFIYNKKYNSKEMLYSLMLALKKNNDDIIFGYSDIIFSYKTIRKIITKSRKNITIPILCNWKKIWKIRNKDPYRDAETLFISNSMRLISIGEKIKKINKIKYQFMGITYIPKSKRNKVINFYDKMKNNDKLHLTTFLDMLIKNGFKIDCIPSDNLWYEFDDYSDYSNYKKHYKVK